MLTFEIPQVRQVPFKDLGDLKTAQRFYRYPTVLLSLVACFVLREGILAVAASTTAKLLGELPIFHTKCRAKGRLIGWGWSTLTVLTSCYFIVSPGSLQMWMTGMSIYLQWSPGIPKALQIQFNDDMWGIHMIYNLRRRGKFFQKPFTTGFGLQFFVLVKLYAHCLVR